MKTRPYRQGRRAEAAAARTEAIMEASVALYAERPLEQITLADIAERAGVGLQTLIRRVGTKDGLIRATNEWTGARIGEARGEPGSSDPDVVAAALERQYEPWGALILRTLRQEELSPALAEGAQAGRVVHGQWIDSAFAAQIAERGPRLRAQLIAVCGVELWMVLRSDVGLSADETRDTVADMIRRLL